MAHFSIPSLCSAVSSLSTQKTFLCLYHGILFWSRFSSCAAGAYAHWMPCPSHTILRTEHRSLRNSLCSSTLTLMLFPSYHACSAAFSVALSWLRLFSPGSLCSLTLCCLEVSGFCMSPSMERGHATLCLSRVSVSP